LSKKIISKQKVKKAFSRQASVYDQHALLQKESAKRLDFILSLVEKQPESLLDIGSGTGFITARALSRWDKAIINCCDIAHGMNIVAASKFDSDRVSFITGDAEALPYKDGSFDMIISNLAYQWVNSMAGAFKEVKRVLKNEGQLIFSTFGHRSLQELRDAYSEAFREIKGNDPEHFHFFPTIHQLGDGFSRIGFEDVTVNADRIKKLYKNPRELLGNLKDIGAGNAVGSKEKGLGSRRVIKRMEEIYNEKFSHKEGIYATFEILFVRAVKRD